nr:MAG TPA: hypothetical protein [Caudoviricetes sp.]
MPFVPFFEFEGLRLKAFNHIRRLASECSAAW